MKKKYLLYNNKAQCWVKFNSESSIPFNNVSYIKEATELNIDECISVIQLMQMYNDLIIIPAPLYNLTSEQVTQIAIQDMIFESANKLKRLYLLGEVVIADLSENAVIKCEQEVENLRDELAKEFDSDIKKLYQELNKIV